MKKNKKIILGLILIASFLFRFYKLAKFPVSLSIDEVIIGYDAYSIAKTGNDHWGEKFPLAFKSVGDYKPPVLVYLMVPVIKLFGLNSFGIRFVIALFGALSVIPVYWLIKLLTGKEGISLWTSFLIAISPWHVHFSRSSFEAILALFFVITGVYFFINTIEKKSKHLWLSGIFFVLSIYSYHAQRVFTPLLLAALLIIYWKQIWQRRKETIFAIVLNFFFLIPFIYIMLSASGQTRDKAQIFTKEYEFATVRMSKLAEVEAPKILAKTPYNRVVQIFSFWANKYLEYSDLSFLFFDGMDYTHDKFPNVGPLLYFGLPFFVWGLFGLSQEDSFKNKRCQYLVIIWILLGPIPASLANGSQHTLRSLTLLPMPMLITAIGIEKFLKFIKNKSYYYLSLFIFVLSIMISLIYYFDIYFVHYPTHYSHYIMYGMDQAAEYVWQNHDQYKNVIFSREFGITGRNITGVPFAYVLTEGHVKPQKIQKIRQEFNEKENLKIDNITFREVDWAKDNQLNNSLLVGSKWHFPLESIKDDKIVKTIDLYNGEDMFYLIKTGDNDN